MNLKAIFSEIAATYLDTCIDCGECIASCAYLSGSVLKDVDPVAVNDGRKALLQDGIFDETTYQLVRSCLLCGECEAVCPVDLDPGRVNIAARLTLAVLPGPVGRRYAGDIANLLPMLPNHPKNRFRFLHQLQMRPEEVQWLSELPESPPQAGHVLFLSCMTLSRADRTLTNLDLMRLVTDDFVALGGVDFCCGFLNVLAGQPADGQRVLDELIAAVRAVGATRFIVDCPTCYGWLRTLSRYEPLPFELCHLSQWLADHVDRYRFTPQSQEIVTVHDACHFGRSEDEYGAVRRVLAAIPQLTVIEMEHCKENTRCCGSPASGYQPDLAATARQERLKEAEATGADRLLSVCEGCIRFLQGGLSATGSKKDGLELDAFSRFVAAALGIEHPNRLAPLYTCDSVDEILQRCSGCLATSFYEPWDLRERISEVFGKPG
jgi:heterodisulfide reductase subunit D